MKTIFWTLLITAATFTAFPTASAACIGPVVQRDAGTLGDAPGYASPRDIAPGSYAGMLNFHAADLEDWYRISIPSGASLRLTFDMTCGDGGFYGGIYPDAGGDFVAQGYTEGNTVVLLVGSGVWRVGFGNQAGQGTAAYDFTAEVV